MRRPANRDRGMTFVTVLMLIGAAAGIYWIIVFVPIYYQDHEIRQYLRQAGNVSYQQKSDGLVRAGILRALDDEFGYDGDDAAGHHARLSKLEYDDNDLRLDRQQTPPMMRIDFHYVRTVKLPIFGGERRLAFDDHIEQDLSVVKW